MSAAAMASRGASSDALILRARLDRAAQLLREADMSVSQVAAIMGYTSPQFFSRQYEAQFGIPPSADRGLTPEPAAGLWERA